MPATPSQLEILNRLASSLAPLVTQSDSLAGQVAALATPRNAGLVEPEQHATALRRALAEQEALRLQQRDLGERITALCEPQREAVFQLFQADIFQPETGRACAAIAPWIEEPRRESFVLGDLGLRHLLQPAHRWHNLSRADARANAAFFLRLLAALNSQPCPAGNPGPHPR